jgi:Domain of unknown function (DUF4394)
MRRIISILITITIVLGTVLGATSKIDGLIPKGLDVFALDNDNTIHTARPLGRFHKVVTVPSQFGQVIGIDFRPADGWLYAITDTGQVLQVDVNPPGVGNIIQVSTLSPRFAGGVQSLADFNPVANALRLIGSNDQNFAVVNGGGNLAQTVPQTRVAYALGDVNFGVDPNVVGGAYTNNVQGAATTIFYGLDYDLDVLVTIAPPLVGAGSSNTGGGQLQTIGQIVDQAGNPINITPTADIDIYTDNFGVNTLVGITGRTLLLIDLVQIDQGLPLGRTQRVAARTVRLVDDGFIDVGVSLRR